MVLDGLRPDAIPRLGLWHLARSARMGASTDSARTVSPSVTAAAMGSLLTGVHPEAHGLTSDRFQIPRPRVPLNPLPAVLRHAGLPTSAFLAGIPRAWRGLAHRMARHLGVDHLSLQGTTASDVVREALAQLDRQCRGLILLHLPDADRAGHRHGWMSDSYEAAARLLDSCWGTLLARTEAWTDPSTLVIGLADHGGGGASPRNHDSEHPADRTIPLILAGGAVRPSALRGGAHLVDVPATVLHLLGVPIPVGYAGRPLLEAVDDPVSDDEAVTSAGAVA